MTVTIGKSKDRKPATVIITAGQSNTDGRVSNDQLPDYIKQNRYKYCHWCYGSAGQPVTGKFELFWPRMVHPSRPDRWAYDAVTYYLLEQALQKDFYVVKWSLGGTAIDTACRSTSNKYWSADPAWLAANHSTATGGRSLLLSFTENIAAAIDSTLSKLPEGYDVKAFLWHQGESDRHQGANYYNNLKAVVAYVRNFLVEKTGKKKYRKLPFICGTVARSNKQYSEEVEKALYRLADENKNFYVIDMSEAQLQRDQLHFTAEASEYLGTQMYNRLVELGVAGKK
ncbi:MAG: sialate O-acetylesterase [Bacteroides sp.]|nr:sialate O-acetylesterase [Bacteroides sp.]